MHLPVVDILVYVGLLVVSFSQIAGGLKALYRGEFVYRVSIREGWLNYKYKRVYRYGLVSRVFAASSIVSGSILTFVAMRGLSGKLDSPLEVLFPIMCAMFIKALGVVVGETIYAQSQSKSQ
jgi:hypothetical protein